MDVATDVTFWAFIFFQRPTLFFFVEVMLALGRLKYWPHTLQTSFNTPSKNLKD